MKKELVLKVLSSLDDEFDIEEFIKRLILVNYGQEIDGTEIVYDQDFLKGIQKAREQIKTGDTRVINIDDL